MVWISGGTFRMGSNDFYPEERLVHRVTVDGFWISEHPVTNAEFGGFVQGTGYITMAGRRPDPGGYSDVYPALLVPGSLVFRQPAHPVSLHDVRVWWFYVPGASWEIIGRSSSWFRVRAWARACRTWMTPEAVHRGISSVRERPTLRRASFANRLWAAH